MYILKIIHSKRDLDYMIPKGISPPIPNTYFNKENISRHAYIRPMELKYSAWQSVLGFFNKG